MSEETKVSNETVVESGTEDVTQEVAQNEYIAESKKYRKRAQEAESELAKLKKTIAAQEEEKLKRELLETMAKRWLEEGVPEVTKGLRLHWKDESPHQDAYDHFLTVPLDVCSAKLVKEFIEGT